MTIIIMIIIVIIIIIIIIIIKNINLNNNSNSNNENINYISDTYFLVIFYIYPKLTTVNRCVKLPRHFENNVEKRQKKKCLGRCVSCGCDWLVL